jgi:preprotein translocase subunit SecD
VAELYEKEDAREYAYSDDTVLLRTVRTFGIQDARVYPDRNGYPAVLFVIADAEKDEFRRWTAGLVGRQMALLVDGKVVAIPNVNSALPGAGIVMDETRHWTMEEASTLAERIRDQSKSPRN